MNSSSESKMGPQAAVSTPPTRPKGRIMWAVAIVIVLLVAAVLGAWAAGLFGKKGEEKVLVVAMADNITIMDPSKANWLFGPAAVIYDTLLTRDLEGGYADGLAQTWNYDRTNLTLTLNLKPNIKFHDGTPCDAAAIKWNIEYQAQGLSGYMFAAIESMWAQDAQTLVCNLSYADASLLFQLSNIYSAIMSPTAIQEYGDQYGTGTRVVGSGQFKIAEWVENDHVTVVKNENYSWAPSWMTNRGAAHIDKIIYRIMSDETSRMLAYEGGSVDVLMSVPPYKIQQYQQNTEMRVLTGQGQGLFYLEFNCAKDPWTNASLRRAFGFAINRTEILDTVWHGVGTPALNYLPPILPETNVDPSLNFSYDPAKAETLLAEAGFTDTDSDGWVENSTGELTLHLWTATRTEDISMGEILKDQIEAIGVHVDMAHYEDNALTDMCSNGDQDVALFKDSWPRADILDWLMGSGNVPYPNTAHFNDSVFDDYIAQGYAATNDQEYTAAMTLAHEEALKNGVWAPIIYWDQVHAVHAYVKGWVVHPLGQETVQDMVDVDISK